ncbi:MAG: hypothetical protein ACI33M_01185 [Lysinibacillus sp.]
MEKHAISHSGSCGCAALRQKRPLLDVSINVPLIDEKVILLINLLSHCAALSRCLVAENELVVRAFACCRTNRGDNAVGSAVWRLARTTDGNQN